MQDDDATAVLPADSVSLLPPQEPTQKTLVGRYKILERLGSGGVGTVWRAYDPKLGRDVAIKRLKAPDSAEQRGRLLQEARSMAQLSHPNVVEVYDAALDDEGDVFIAMELIEGVDLRRWLGNGRPSWREALRVFVMAGRGLAAAHEAGLVHRDFKPANVLMSEAGTVHVTDFGIARGTQSDSGAPMSGRGDSADSLGPLSSAISASATDTATGLVLGTPGYMAPEQHYGKEVGPAADQYALCISLWEALCGRRPFTGLSPSALRSAKSGGPPAWPAEARSVPKAVQLAIIRGLSPEQGDRFDSINALLEHLDLRTRSGSWLPLLLVGTGIAGAVFIAIPESTPTCREGLATRGVRYDEPARTSIAEALRAEDLPYASETLSRVDATLADYAQRLQEERVSVCEAARLRSDPERDQELATVERCLDTREAALRTVLATLSAAEEATLERALPVVQGLPSLARCRDESTLQARAPVPDDPSTAREVSELRNRLQEAAMMMLAGRYKPADELLAVVVAQADSLGYAPVHAEALTAAASAAVALGEYPRAKEQGEKAYFLASQESHDGVGARAAVLIAKAEAAIGPDSAAIDRWLGYARVAVARANDPQLEARLLLSSAEIANELGDPASAARRARAALVLAEPGTTSAQAVVRRGALTELGLACARATKLECANRALQRSVELHTQELGADHPALARLHTNFAYLLAETGRLKDARGHFERAVELARITYGEAHPGSATVIANYALYLAAVGETEAALDTHDGSYQVTAAHYGDDHPRTWGALEQRAGILQRSGKLPEALAIYTRVLDGYERTCPDDTGRLISVTNNLGVVHHLLEQYEDALPHYQRALELRGDSTEPINDHARALANIGMLQAELKHFADADKTLGEAVAEYQQLVPKDNPELLTTTIALAKVLAARGESERARALAEGVVTEISDATLPWDAAQWHLGVAQVLWEPPTDRQAAAASLDRARASLADTNSPQAQRAKVELDAWVASRGP